MSWKFKFLFAGNTVCALGASFANLFYHSKNAEALKNELEFKNQDKPVPVPKKVIDLFQQVMNDMKLSEEIRSKIEPFIKINFKPSAIGHVHFLSKSWIGVPQTFLLDNKMNIEVNAVVDEHEIPSDAAENNEIKATLHLSEKAKKFVIAREIFKTKDLSFYLDSFSPVISGGFIAAFLMQQKQKIITSKALIIMLLPFAFFINFAVQDFIRPYKNVSVDFKVSELGKSYIEGGLEYYGKEKKRNMLFKKVNQKALLTDDGEEVNFFLSCGHIKLQERIDYLKKLLSDSEEKPSMFKIIFLSFAS